MLYNEEYLEIGHLRKGHGNRGYARIEVDNQFLDHLLETNFIFFEIDGYKVPFHIEEIDFRRNLLIKFKTLDTPEHLLPYHQKSIYVLKREVEHLLKLIENDTEESEWVGRRIIDNEIGEVGEIIKVEQFPQQIIAFVKYNSAEIMIPIHDSLISSIDNESGIIYMELPDGLLEI